MNPISTKSPVTTQKSPIPTLFHPQNTLCSLNKNYNSKTFEMFFPLLLFDYFLSKTYVGLFQNSNSIILKTLMLTIQNRCIPDNNEEFDKEVCQLDKTVNEEKENDTKTETLYRINEENHENDFEQSADFKEEDLKNLLLYYMKLTLEQRKKTNGGGDENSENPDSTVKNDYFVSTDYDSEEESSSKKSAPPTLKCLQCSKLLRGIHSLKNHYMRKHSNHSKKNVLCDKCPTLFYTDFEFNRHYQTHYSIKNYLCDLCSKKFYQKSSLELHLRYHKNDRRYQCEICRKRFFTNNHLKRHNLTHTNRRDFRCEPCGRSFRYKDHLQRHLQNVHIGVRSHYCRECGKPFMFLSQLKFHELSHQENSYKCSNCKQTFKKRISLKAHQRECKK